MRGSQLIDLIGVEATQWFNTKFNTWTGAFEPFFDTELFDHWEEQTIKFKIVQRRRLPILDLKACSSIRELLGTRKKLQDQVLPLAKCRSVEFHQEPLCQIRRVLMRSIQLAFLNGSRSVLRGFLYHIQPRTDE